MDSTDKKWDWAMPEQKPGNIAPYSEDPPLIEFLKTRLPDNLEIEFSAGDVENGVYFSPDIYVLNPKNVNNEKHFIAVPVLLVSNDGKSISYGSNGPKRREEVEKFISEFEESSGTKVKVLHPLV